MSTRWPWALLGLLYAAIVALPFIVNSYVLFVLTQVAINCIVALGLNLVLGYAGQFAFANAAFVAVGAYTVALVKLHFGVPYLLGLPLAGIVTAAVGIVVGLPALRLRGLYLAMATMAFALFLQWLLVHWPSVTFGAGGVSVPAPDFASPFAYETNVYLLSVLVASVTALAIWNLVRSPVGRAFVALRDTETGAQAVGVHLARYKTVAFALSAFCAGIAGGLHVALLRFVAPESYDLAQMVMHFTMVVVGGLGSISGSLIGAVLITWLPEVLRAVKGVQEIVFGVILMCCMVFMPDGVYGMLRRRLGVREPLHRRVG